MSHRAYILYPILDTSFSSVCGAFVSVWFAGDATVGKRSRNVDIKCRWSSNVSLNYNQQFRVSLFTHLDAQDDHRTSTGSTIPYKKPEPTKCVCDPSGVQQHLRQLHTLVIHIMLLNKNYMLRVQSPAVLYIV